MVGTTNSAHSAMNHSLLRLAGFTASALLWTLCAAAPAAPLAPADQRMLRLAELWRDVRFLHPELATGKVDWDMAMATSLPALQSATTAPQLHAALTQLMAPIRDASVLAAPPEPAPYVVRDDAAAPVEWLPGDIALLRLHHAPSRAEEAAFAAAHGDIAARARGVIVDLRPDGPGFVAESVVQQLVAQLIDSPVQLPAIRSRTHAGYRAQQGEGSGGYTSGFEIPESELVLPARKTRAVPLVFVTNIRRSPPMVALALQRRGQAWIVAQGGLWAPGLLPQRTALIDKGVAVRFPLGELVYDDGSTGAYADATPPADGVAGPASPVVVLARGLLEGGKRPGPPAVPRLTQMPLRMADKPYEEMPLPTLGWRQLAVIKLWAVADAFFPYQEGMTQPLQASLPRFLREMETVDSPAQYALALQRMAATLEDSHVRLVSAELDKHLGMARVSVPLVRAEGKIAVAGLHPDSAAAKAGLQSGDVVLRVDGEDAQLRARRLGELLGGSTPAGRDHRGLGNLLRGDADKPAVLEIERAGQVRTVSLARATMPANMSALTMPRTAAAASPAAYRLLDARTGYANLTLLQPAQIDAMFDALGQTDSLILDMRGYPKGVWLPLAARLNVRKAQSGVAISRPILSYKGKSNALFFQAIPPARFAPYQGKVIMLINETAMSQAEHTAMFVAAAAPVTFIGATTSGTNGDLTNTLLPGNVLVEFTGQDIRYPDGRPLQRVGIQPHIPSAPTLAGLRAGRDEVLERAIAFARDGK